MFIWTAIEIENQLKELKRTILKTEKEVGFENPVASTLPLHISLKISTEATGEDEIKLRADIEALFERTKPFKVAIDKLELYGGIVWIKMKENPELQYLHKELCDISLRYGIELHEYDLDFVYHSTLFFDSDIEKINEAYELIKNVELPTELVANTFITGSSPDGTPGTYKVDTRSLRR